MDLKPVEKHQSPKLSPLKEKKPRLHTAIKTQNKYSYTDNLIMRVRLNAMKN
jgi:hypothetical protein